MDLYELVPDFRQMPQLQAELAQLASEAMALESLAMSDPSGQFQELGSLAARESALIAAGAPIAEIRELMRLAREIAAGHPEAIARGLAERVVSVFEPAIQGFEVLLAGPPTPSSALDAVANIVATGAAACGILAVCFPPAAAVAVVLGAVSLGAHAGADAVRPFQRGEPGWAPGTPGEPPDDPTMDQVYYTPEERTEIEQSLVQSLEWVLDLFMDAPVDPFSVEGEPTGVGKPDVWDFPTNPSEDILDIGNPRKIDVVDGKVVAASL